MKSTDTSGVRRISANLPEELITGVDQLKKEWGLRSRGAVIERLLEDVFSGISDNNNVDNSKPNECSESGNTLKCSQEYLEDKAIVLIGNSDIEILNSLNNEETINNADTDHKVNNSSLGGIDLPGFVQSKTAKLRKTLNKQVNKINEFESYINTVKEKEVNTSLKSAKDHWYSLYGNKPSENVIEAAMIWLARDIWPHIDGGEDIPFTWSAANKLMKQYCVTWQSCSPNLERIIVLAGVLEDPFSSKNLQNRVPTIIKRFVNSFKRRPNTTSFQTIESTMTVHGALKLLGLPTLAGSSLTLRTIRDAYKEKALQNHPDSGGSTEAMRKLNEGYQLLKDLYKSK